MRPGPSELSKTPQSTKIVRSRQGILIRFCFVHYLVRFAANYRSRVTLIKGHDGAMGELSNQLNEYRLTTAENLYYMPDHPALLQSLVWHFKDRAPQYPKLHEFLEYG